MCYANTWLMVKEFIFKTYVFSGFWVLTITPPLFSEDFKVTTFFVFQLTQFLEMWDKSVYKYIFDLLNKYFWIKLVDLSKLKSKYLKALKPENLKRWTIHKRHLSDVPVSRNWYKTVSKLYQIVNITTKTSANSSAVYWSRDTRDNDTVWYSSFQIGCVFVEYGLLNTTNSIRNLI